MEGEKEKMSFMQPEVTNEEFEIIETTNGTEMFPVGTISDSELLERINYQVGKKDTNFTSLEDAKSENLYKRETAFFARLSAPGYTDCTDWIGPFENEVEAMQELDLMYDLEDEDLNHVNYKRCPGCLLVFPISKPCECEK